MPQTPQKDHDTGEYRTTQTEYNPEASPERWAEIEASWQALDEYYGPLIESARPQSHKRINQALLAARHRGTWTTNAETGEVILEEGRPVRRKK